MFRIAFIVSIFLSQISLGQSIYDQDISMGKENAQAVEFQFGIMDDMSRTAYVRTVGKRLVRALDTTYFPFSFQIVPTIEPNAFALPGGYCYVTTGLLELLSTEEELACVLAHEIIHSQNRHGIKMQKKGLLPALLSIPGSVIGVFNKDLGALVSAPVNVSGALVMAKYGRGFETEADIQGIKLAAKAGYDPAALKTALQKLSDVVELATGHKQERSYFNDHPITEDRVKRIDATLKDIEVKPIAPQGALNDIVNGLLVGTPAEYGKVYGDTLVILPAERLALNLPKGFVSEIYAGAFMASEATQQAIVSLVPLPDTLTMKRSVEEIRKQLKDLPKEFKLSDEAFKQNGLDGHRIEFINPQSRYRERYFVWWVRTPEGVMQVAAIAAPNLEKSVRNSLSTMRRISDSEKALVYQRFVQIVRAKPGETIEEIGIRSSNTMSLDMTSLINEYPPKEKLPEGTPIRVVVRRPYF